MRTSSIAKLTFATVSLGTALLLPKTALAVACVGSPTNLCVAHTNPTGFTGTYTIDDGSGAVAQKALTLNAGTTYTFQLVNLVNHPFYITTASVGLTSPVVTGSVMFTPTGTTPVNIFYQCANHANMGGPITVNGGGDAGAPADAGSDASTRDGGTSSGDAGTAGDGGGSSSSSSSSSSGAASSTSSASSSGSVVQPGQEDTAGCSVGATGASAWLGLSIAALAQFAARRRRRNAA